MRPSETNETWKGQRGRTWQVEVRDNETVGVSLLPPGLYSHLPQGGSRLGTSAADITSTTHLTLPWVLDRPQRDSSRARARERDAASIKRDGVEDKELERSSAVAGV